MTTTATQPSPADRDLGQIAADANRRRFAEERARAERATAAAERTARAFDLFRDVIRANPNHIDTAASRQSLALKCVAAVDAINGAAGVAS